jgi:hypothetical protein
MKKNHTRPAAAILVMEEFAHLLKGSTLLAGGNVASLK